MKKVVVLAIVVDEGREINYMREGDRMQIYVATKHCYEAIAQVPVEALSENEVGSYLKPSFVALTEAIHGYVKKLATGPISNTT